MSNSLFFIDGLRSIDFVCVWSSSENDETEESRARQRIVFEDNLETEGLHLEREVVKDDLHFIKVKMMLFFVERRNDLEFNLTIPDSCSS